MPRYLRIRILFRDQDLSLVKEYCQRSWTKVLEDKASVQDFIFAREVYMGSYRYIEYLQFWRVYFIPDVAIKFRHLQESL
jgi:hypothetical protein